MVTDYQLLYSIFNEISKGLTKTERRKLRHQDIRYKVIYQRRKTKQDDKDNLKNVLPEFTNICNSKLPSI